MSEVSRPAAPRWVKVFGLVAVAAFLLFLVVMATAGAQLGGQ